MVDNRIVSSRLGPLAIALLLSFAVSGIVFPDDAYSQPLTVTETEYFQLTGAWHTLNPEIQLPVREMSFGPVPLDQSALAIDLGSERPSIQLDLIRFSIESVAMTAPNVATIRIESYGVARGYCELRFIDENEILLFNHIENMYMYGEGGEEVFRRDGGPVLVPDQGRGTTTNRTPVYGIPSRFGERVGLLSSGESVEIVGRLGAFPLPPDEAWSKVRSSNGLEGWVPTESLRESN
jgi:hypothetical protein